MFRIAIFVVVLASSLASRVTTSGDAAKTKAEFGPTCDDLHSIFHNRVNDLQTMLDSLPNDNTFTRITQARFTMKTVGVARVLRRAQTCTWVVEGDDDDVEHMRGIAQVMLAGNPCAHIARTELNAATSDDSTIELAAVGRAMSILVSENCEAALDMDEDVPTMNLDDDAELEARIEEVQQQAQDTVDELMDTATGEESNGAFVETSPYGGVFRTLGVVFLFLVLLMACATAGAFIGVMIGAAYATIAYRGWACHFCGQLEVMMGFAVGGVVGLGSCAYTFSTQLLPRLAVDR